MSVPFWWYGDMMDCFVDKLLLSRKFEPKIYFDPIIKYAKLEIVEILFMKDYIVNILLILINENVRGGHVTYV